MKAKKFWYWMNERQSIYIQKEKGYRKPWTTDKILQRYKFTNVFRQQDRVTVELGKRLNKSDPHWMLLWKIYVFRMFNLPATYDLLSNAGLIMNWNVTRAKKVLRAAQKRKEQIFTGAYIITNAGSTRPKIDIICEALSPMWTDRKLIAKWIRQGNSIEEAVDLLTRFPNVGKFVGYEIATDLRHTPILNKATDIMTWANPGPGAMRGLNRIYGEGPKDNRRMDNFQWHRPDYIAEMQELLSMSNDTLGSIDRKIFGSVAFEMRDIEHSLCEFDKYMRVLKGEGRPRSKYHGF